MAVAPGGGFFLNFRENRWFGPANPSFKNQFPSSATLDMQVLRFL